MGPCGERRRAGNPRPLPWEGVGKPLRPLGLCKLTHTHTHTHTPTHPRLVGSSHSRLLRRLPGLRSAGDLQHKTSHGAALQLHQPPKSLLLCRLAPSRNGAFHRRARAGERSRACWVSGERCPAEQPEAGRHSSRGPSSWQARARARARPRH